MPLTTTGSREKQRLGSLPKALGEPTIFCQHLDWNINIGHLASDLGKNVSTVLTAKLCLRKLIPSLITPFIFLKSNLHEPVLSPVCEQRGPADSWVEQHAQSHRHGTEPGMDHIMSPSKNALLAPMNQHVACWPSGIIQKTIVPVTSF